MGLWIYCLSIAVVFARLGCAVGPSHNAKAIQIGGIGSMVYSAFTPTPMHDLMVTISCVFLAVALVALLYVLYARRVMGFFVAGMACFLLFAASVTIYYSGRGGVVLPWAQRTLFTLFAVWLVALDLKLQRP